MGLAAGHGCIVPTCGAASMLAGWLVGAATGPTAVIYVRLPKQVHPCKGGAGRFSWQVQSLGSTLPGYCPPLTPSMLVPTGR